MLYIFDIDGTLTEKWKNDLLPGVAEWFDAHYHPTQHSFAFATNQGGVGLRLILERQGKKAGNYPTAESIVSRLHDLSERLTGDAHGIMSVAAFNYYDEKSGEWAVAYDPATMHEWWDPNFRKPAPGMLQFIMEVHGAMAENTVMVGDSEDDRKAAEAAGVRFVDASAFFGD